jgi:hypothetical protein
MALPEAATVCDPPIFSRIAPPTMVERAPPTVSDSGALLSTTRPMAFSVLSARHDSARVPPTSSTRAAPTFWVRAPLIVVWIPAAAIVALTLPTFSAWVAEQTLTACPGPVALSLAALPPAAPSGPAVLAREEPPPPSPPTPCASPSRSARD